MMSEQETVKTIAVKASEILEQVFSSLSAQSR